MDDTSGYLVNGEFSTEFSAEGIGEYIITATVDNQKINIPITVAPLTWYVNASKTSSGDGKSEETAFMTLNEAICAAADGDIIMIASGTYTGDKNVGLRIDQNNLNLIKYGDSDAIFDAQSAGEILYFIASSEPRSINIKGLTFKNAGIYAIGFYGEYGVSDSRINATFINIGNGKWGSAIYAKSADNVDITGTFINNTAGEGLINLFNVNNINIHDSIFINNGESTIFMFNGSSIIYDNWFGNTADDYNITPTGVYDWQMINWLFLNATANPSEIGLGKSSTITFDMYTYSNGFTYLYNKSMNIQLDLTQTLGELDKPVASLGEEITYTAKDNGNASVTGTFETASQTIRLTNNDPKIPTEIKIANSTVNLKANDEIESGATLTPADAGNVTYTSSNSSVAVVVNGKIKALAAGSANITVSFAGNDNYSAAENKTIVVNVALADASVSVNNDTLDLVVKGTFDLEATTVPSGLKVSYSSTNESVVTVNSDGKVTAVGAGNATIVVTVGDDKVYAINSTNVSVNVKIPTAIRDIPIHEMSVGDGYTLYYPLVDSNTGSTIWENLEYTVTSTNESVVKAYFDNVIVIECVGEGNANVTAGFAGNDKYAAAENKTFTLTVNKVPTEISVANSTVDLKVNDEIDAGASLTPADAGNVTYTSSNSSVAVVENGKIKALAEGNATITVSFAGDNTYAAAENKTITVNVSLNDASLSVDNSTLDLFVGDYYTLTVNTSPEGLNVTFTPDNSGVVSVDENGKVTALKEGKGSVRVSVGGDGVYEFKSVDVTVAVKKIPTEISVANSTVDLKVNDEIDAGASLTPADAGNVTYTSSNSSVAVVENGKIKALAEGNATITVSFAGDDKYAAAESKNVTVTVSKVETSIDVDVDSVDLKVGDDGKINASVAPADAGELDYTSSDVSVVTVNGIGEVTAVGDGKVYKMVNATVTVTVSKVATEIVVNNATLDMHVGDVASDVASLRPFLVDNVTYTSTNSSVVKVEGDQLVAVGNGSAIVIVSYAGDDKYAAAESKNVTVTVTKVETSISVDVDSVDMKVGDEAQINANVTPADAGELDFTSSDVSVVTVNGIGELEAVGDGTAVITIKLIGDEKYAPVSKNITVTVSKTASKFAEVIIVKDNVTMILSDENGNPIAGANISYAVNGASNDTVSDDNGSFMIIGEPGASIDVNYAGSDVYLHSNITINMMPVRKSTVVLGENYTQYAIDYYAGERGQNFTVQLKDTDGNVLANKTVLIGYNGKTLERTTDENGYASVQINLKDKNRLTFAVTFLGDKEYNATMSVYLITIKQKPVTISASAKTYKATAKSKKYTVALKSIKGASADGKTYFKAGKKVTLKLNGKTYTAKTNAKGQATFSLKITKKGKFTAVIKYAGDSTYKSASKKVKIITM